MKNLTLLIAFVVLGGSMSAQNQWAFLRGNFNTGTNGVYGTQGVPSGGTPGSRYLHAGWSDGSGNFWMFGGYGYGASIGGRLNDLWRYNPTADQWTWMKGDVSGNVASVYGTVTIASNTNKPGGRESVATWKDGSGNLWLFGGTGYAGSNADFGSLNDLWRYNPAVNQWTWMKGNNTSYLPGVYGTQGVASVLNKPGSRSDAMSWTDANGNLWLFGGYGVGNDYNNEGALCDLWKYNIATNQWTFMKGDSGLQSTANYGIQGVESPLNQPPRRQNGCTWTDASGNLWLFGGASFGNPYGIFNDLWKYNPATNNWTWINGDSQMNQNGVYGNLGIPSATSKPGSRSMMNAWTDSNGNFWVFGGQGYAQIGFGRLNDMWKYNPVTNQWAWIHGSNLPDGNGVFGSQGIPAPANVPNSRFSAANAFMNGGNFGLFGGYGIDNNNFEGYYNDLWKFVPCSGNIILSPFTGNLCYTGNPITLTASGGSNYEWYKDGVLISGANTSQYSANSSGAYYVKGAAGNCPAVFSNEVVLPSPAVSPFLSGTGIYCPGDPVSVGMPVTQVGQSYTWRLGTVSVYGPIGGNGGNQSLNFNMDLARAGTYRVLSTKTGCDSVFSNYVFIGIAVISNLATTSVCADRVSFGWTKVAPDSLPQLYQYAVTNSPVPPASGTATSGDTVSVQGLSPSALYYIHVRSACGDLLSSFGNWSTISFITKSSNHIPLVSPESVSLCNGGSQLLTATGGSSAQWLLNGQSIAGATSLVYVVSSAGTYSAIITNNGCSLASLNNTLVTVGTLAPDTAEWIGVNSTDWNNPANWLCGQLPQPTSTVIVNGGRNFYPHVTSNITLKAIQVNTGGTVNVDTGVVITLTGN